MLQLIYSQLICASFNMSKLTEQYQPYGPDFGALLPMEVSEKRNVSKFINENINPVIKN